MFMKRVEISFSKFQLIRNQGAGPDCRNPNFRNDKSQENARITEMWNVI